MTYKFSYPEPGSNLDAIEEIASRFTTMLRLRCVWIEMISSRLPSTAWMGSGKMYQLFGERMDEVIRELNEALAA